ncbi:MAG: IS21 family transposase [Eubacteriales bacterium]|nr:IS21 family transposase [Eubacteriales bacterium]
MKKNDKINQMIAAKNLLEVLNLKVNYSELGRQYGMDPRTVKKYLNGYQGKPSSKPKPSRLDQYQHIIREKLQINRVSRKGVYQFILAQYGFENVGSYSNFKKYVKKHQLNAVSEKCSAHPPYEVDSGKQIQCDWKEDITLHNRDGEEITFNVFHMVLKFSRYSYLEFSIHKTQDDVFRALINGFRYFGGISEELLFDNMSTASTRTSNGRKVNTKLKQFAKDFGFKARLCGVKSPFTKGSNEARNKMIDWLRPYDYEFDTTEDLIQIISNMNRQMNIEVCQGISLSPIAVYYKEKEYLDPLPNNKIIETYLNGIKYKVSNEGLVLFEGKRYSVPPELIYEDVTIDHDEFKLYIYYNGKMVTEHNITDNPINMKQEHYKQMMKNKVQDDDLEDVVQQNLHLFDTVYEKQHSIVTKQQAVESFEAFVAYISTNDYRRILNVLTRLSPEDRMILFEQFQEILPYVIDEEQFIYHFKHYFDYKHVEDFVLNALIDCSYNDSCISSEGLEILTTKYEEKYSQTVNEINRELYKAACEEVDNDIQ